MREHESGNVFFYIFVCIALLAALSYAVAQGSRSSVTTLTDDRRRLVATEIIGYGDIVSKAVTQLRLRGTQVDQLSFANTVLPSADYGDYDCIDPPDTCPAGTGPQHEIFNPAGGAVVYSDPPAEATAGDWQFLSDNAIQNIGSTCTSAECSDLIMALGNVQQDVCMQINDMLGVSNPDRDGAGPLGAEPPLDTDVVDGTATFKPGDAFGYTDTIGDEDNALDGQREACFDGNGTQYIYYKVLLPR